MNWNAVGRSGSFYLRALLEHRQFIIHHSFLPRDAPLRPELVRTFTGPLLSPLTMGVVPLCAFCSTLSLCIAETLLKNHASSDARTEPNYKLYRD